MEDVKMFDDDNSLFGDLFDFDGDGKTDVFEEALGFAMLDDLFNEEKAAEDDGFDDDDEDF